MLDLLHSYVVLATAKSYIIVNLYENGTGDAVI